jgi:hypothetical protein
MEKDKMQRTTDDDKATPDNSADIAEISQQVENSLEPAELYEIPTL